MFVNCFAAVDFQYNGPAAYWPAPMLRRKTGGTAASIQRPKPPPPEVGVYWKNGFAFTRIEGQVISQAKVGGKAGSMFTYGLRNEHWDAYLDGPQSKNVVSDRQPVFYIYVPDGGGASDYTLISLEKKGNRREFQIGSFGGIIGGKSGVKRDKEIAFTAEHAGIRTYRLKLAAEMKPGEYAFFMGTGQQSTMAGDSTGGARSGGEEEPDQEAPLREESTTSGSRSDVGEWPTLQLTTNEGALFMSCAAVSHMGGNHDALQSRRGRQAGAHVEWDCRGHRCRRATLRL